MAGIAEGMRQTCEGIFIALEITPDGEALLKRTLKPCGMVRC
jgi:hypothetical protein